MVFRRQAGRLFVERSPNGHVPTRVRIIWTTAPLGCCGHLSSQAVFRVRSFPAAAPGMLAGMGRRLLCGGPCR
jgi:hypothetical protein